MKNIKIIAFIFTAVLFAGISFAQTAKDRQDYIQLPDNLRGALETVNVERASSLASEIIGRDNSFAQTKRSLTEQNRKQIEKEVQARMQKFSEIKAYYIKNNENNADGVQKKLNKSFQNFMNESDEHKKEYYQIMANYLLKFVNVKIFSEYYDIAFKDGKEFAEAFKNDDFFDNYVSWDDAILCGKDWDRGHETKKVLDNVQLVMLNNGQPIASISFIAPKLKTKNYIYVHRWHNQGVIGKKNNRHSVDHMSINVSPDNDSAHEALREPLTKAGAPIKN